MNLHAVALFYFCGQGMLRHLLDSKAPASLAVAMATTLLLCAAMGCEPARQLGGEEPTVLKASGQTMGTYYSVTIADPPEGFPEDWDVLVDAELREVNDQMSTYLKSSELSRFNQSDSTEWFEVSPETALVVEAAQRISEFSGGAFDVTVGPLVNIWNFGPTKRTKQPPSVEAVEKTLEAIGYQHLNVRLDPPALQKKIPGLQVDLSAIAKGHGVDRIVELLEDLGCENAFVDIGGEDRAVGRRGDRAWRVAIEDPNEEQRVYRLAFELVDSAIATSGDYRNFFEFEGKRYSHTIDPRTGQPVTNQVASVSVFADDCMTADGWATAITVLGSKRGLEIANKLDLAVRIVERNDDGTFTSVSSQSFPQAIPIDAGG